ncbi:MAG: enolase C-terminal domain-like protein [Candidatus Acidiferrales bacterium]
MSSTALKSTSPRVDSVEVSAYTVPTDFPESDGTIEWKKTTIVIAEANCGKAAGMGYTYADASTAKLISSHLKDVVEGRDAMDVAGSWLAMIQSVRNLGQRGIASMAISAVDVALWDLKAKLLGLPLVKLIGGVRSGIPVYGSGGFTSYSLDQIRSQLSGWTRSGIRMVKMKVGRKPEDDPRRVRAAREAIGENPELFVDANGAYNRKQALALAFQFRELGVTWFEEPVSSDDLEGLRLMRDRGPAGMAIAAGEYGYYAGYFRRMLEAGAVDVLQADATRCGGVTGFLQASALCTAHSMQISAHTAPALHAHLCCAALNAIHLEYFHDHVRIENMLFDGVQQPRNGELVPDVSRPGLGVSLKRNDAKRFEVH